MAENSNYTNVEALPEIVGRMHKSFDSGKTRPLEYRKQQIRNVLKMLDENKEELAQAMAKDMGKPRFEAFAHEIMPAEYEAGQFLAHMDKWLKPEKPFLAGEYPIFLFDSGTVQKSPQGVVLIISPWNYPIRLSLNPLIGAIAAGNTVVMKLSEICEHTTALTKTLIEKYLDPDCVQVVLGGPEETGQLMKQRFDHFFYTGNPAVGKIVGRAAMDQLAKVTLELGGKNPTFVANSCLDISTAASRIMWGKTINCGQTCVAPDYVLAEKDVYAPLVKAMSLYPESVFGKNIKSSPDFGRVVSKRQFDRLYNLLSTTKGKFVTGSLEECDPETLYIPPTIITDIGLDDPLMQDEIFGPILPVISIDSIDEGLDIVKTKEYPLALYAFANKKDSSFILQNTRSGSISINDTVLQMVTARLPFGGFGNSGLGSYSGKYSIDVFSHQRTVLNRSISFPPPGVDSVRMPPYENWKYKILSTAIFTTPKEASKSIFGYLFRLIPGWRLLGVTPSFIVAFFKGKRTLPPISKNK
ncbi:hypothetical protein H4219_004284 [Mycoemilia scoparia]|uniref:Aldehyde dehydrogenase n=1 Tax=Mycoemilia scoparia TaxID=417184 RepID=A0A9W7ZT18_9FUNG|nr:hypothetical protein H4219_004284 [Mycoemilia scoparia]